MTETTKRTAGVMRPEGHPCICWITRSILCRSRDIPPICGRRRTILWVASRLVCLLPSILKVVRSRHSIPGLPPESLRYARTGRGLVKDENKGEEAGKPDGGCSRYEKRTKKPEKAAAGQGHANEQQGANTVKRC